MTINCSHHRSKPAHFCCNECGDAFCESCISVRDTMGYGLKDKEYFCPVCNIPAEHLGVGNLITPFWNRLPGIFLYPLQVVTLVLTLILATLGSVFYSIPLVQLAVWIVMMKYAYAVLIQTSTGSLKAPEVTFELVNADIGQVFKQFVILILIGVITGFVFSKTGPYGGFPFVAFIAIFAPAMLMVLVATNSVIQAMNPMVFVPIVSRIGGRYFLMYLFLFFLYAAPSTVLAMVPNVVPYAVIKFFSLLFGQYYVLVSYHLMGYVLLQYHEEIGYDVDYEHFMDNPEKGERKKIDEKEKLLIDIGILVQKGRYDDALVLIKSETHGKIDNLELSEHYLKLLQLTGKMDETLAYANKHLNLLIKNNRKQKAIEVFEKIVAKGSTVTDPNDLFTLAGWFKDRLDHKKSFSCYADYIKLYKGHKHIPEAYFELAQIMYEQGKNNAKAEKILKGMIQSFPDHHLVPEVQAYLTAMS